MRISQIFAMGAGYDSGPYYSDYEGRSDNPCYSSWPYCESAIGPFDYGPRGDRKGLAHILGSAKEGGGILGILAH
ncbi:MAG: hypothetical protein ACRDRA_06060 [Pseudonocardiaceae bacterium]